MKKVGTSEAIAPDRSVRLNVLAVLLFSLFTAVLLVFSGLLNHPESCRINPEYSVALTADEFRQAGFPESRSWSDNSQTHSEPICKRNVSRRQIRTLSIGEPEAVCQGKSWILTFCHPAKYLYNNIDCKHLQCKSCIFVRDGPEIDVY